MKPIKSNKGFTLMELILAIAVFGIMSVIFLTIFSSSLMITVRSGQREEGLVAASSTLDDTAKREDSVNVLGTTFTHPDNGAKEKASEVKIVIEYFDHSLSEELDGYTYDVTADVKDQSVNLKGFGLK